MRFFGSIEMLWYILELLNDIFNYIGDKRYVTVKVNSNEVPSDKITGLDKYLIDREYKVIKVTKKCLYAKKVNDIYRSRNFYVHIYIGEEIKIRTLEPNCFEILSYLVGRTRASILINFQNC